MTDKFYTPDWIADQVAAAVPPTAQVVMDMAAGLGALLQATEKRTAGSLDLIALDRDPSAVAALKSTHPDWTVGRIDVLSPGSRRSSPIWHAKERVVDAIVLNPPYSYRGRQAHPVRFDGNNVFLTPASAFVGLALERVSPQGCVVALLPSNAMELERDQCLWDSIRAKYRVDVLAEFDRRSFTGARARTVLIRIDKGIAARTKSGSAIPREECARTNLCRCVDVVRGRVPRHLRSQQAAGAPESSYVHTTDLVGGELVLSGVTASNQLATKGPFILIPRVGRMYREKIVRVAADAELVLSDCLFALRAVDASTGDGLYRSLVSDYQSLEAIYRGSCAPYATLARLVDLLEASGYFPRHVRASAQTQTCTCRT